MIHAATLSKSKRLQRVLRYLLGAPKRGRTTREIQTTTETCNAHTAVAELRANGYPIDCKLERITEDGSRVHRYTITRRAK